MNFSTSGLRITLLTVLLLTTVTSFADTNCEEGSGALNPAQPQGVSTQEIIQKFTAREDVFRQARLHYAYTQDITVQELDGTAVTGEFRLVQDVSFNDKGEIFENVTFAPQSGLRQLSLAREDYDDFRNKAAFFLTSSELLRYNLLYAGQQHVDEIETYVFDVAPKTLEKGQRYFQGRIWVDQRELQIVKTCGKTVPELMTSNNKKKKNKNVEENISPKFVSYRELIDGQYWFPTYIRSDDTLHFRFGDIQMREVIKLTNYKRSSGATNTTLQGQAKQGSNATAKKP